MNWRGRPLTSHEVIVNTIAATTTRTGLTVSAELDTGDYPKGIKISDREIQNLEKQNVLRRHDFHGEWNYCLDPPLPPPETSVLFICGRLDATIREIWWSTSRRWPLPSASAALPATANPSTSRTRASSSRSGHVTGLASSQCSDGRITSAWMSWPSPKDSSPSPMAEAAGILPVLRSHASAPPRQS